MLEHIIVIAVVGVFALLTAAHLIIGEDIQK